MGNGRLYEKERVMKAGIYAKQSSRTSGNKKDAIERLLGLLYKLASYNLHHSLF